MVIKATSEDGINSNPGTTICKRSHRHGIATGYGFILCILTSYVFLHHVFEFNDVNLLMYPSIKARRCFNNMKNWVVVSHNAQARFGRVWAYK